jgi:hypothetical protein
MHRTPPTARTKKQVIPMRRDRPATPRRTLRLAVVGFIVALGPTAPIGDRVEAVGTASVAPASPDPTEPPVDEPPEEPIEPEPEPEPGNGTASEDESTLEPGDVPAAVWVGAILLVVAAVFWAVRQSSKESSSADG